MILQHATYIYIRLLVVVIELRPTGAGPSAVIQKLPVTVALDVVTTKTYVYPACRLRVIRNCRLPLLSSSDAIIF
jgi:hypothetical protein